MVRIGEVFWEASVKGADEATGTAAELEDSMGRVASTAQEAAEAQNEYGAEVEETGEAMDDTSLMSGKLGTSTDLLGSSLFGVAKSFGIAATAAKGYAAALGLAGAARGGVATLSGLLAGTSLAGLVSKSSLTTMLKAAPAIATLVVAADTIGAFINGEDPITAFVSSVQNIGAFIVNPLGIENGLVESVVGIGTFILGSMSIASFITGVPISAMITGAAGAVGGAATTIASFLGVASLTTLVAGAGSIAALIGGVASLGDLVDGDISSWNLPAKFGHALGQGFQNAWPDMASTIRTGFTQNPIADFGSEVGAEFGMGDKRARETEGIVNFKGFPVDVPVLQSGGIIDSSGLAQVHKGEAVLPKRFVEPAKRRTRVGGGGGGGTTVEQNYDIDVGDQTLDLSRLDRSTLRELANMINDELGATTGNLAGGK